MLGIGRDGLELRGEWPEHLVETSGFDLFEGATVARLVSALDPVDVYYLAAHHVSSEGNVSLALPGAEVEAALLVNVRGPLRFLEALRDRDDSRFFFASSSLVFGDQGSGVPQNEHTLWSPGGVYGLTKALTGHACREYRAKHGIFCSVGYLYNHESVHRSGRFFSKKVCAAALRIRGGSPERLKLGNLDAVVDWGYAPDYVEAFTRILALPEPGDFIIATGEAHTAHEFLEVAFSHVGLRWQDHVDAGSEVLGRSGSGRVGDSSKLRRLTGWRPSLSFEAMVRRLVDDLAGQDLS